MIARRSVNEAQPQSEAGVGRLPSYFPVFLALVIMCVRFPPGGLVGWLNGLLGGSVPLGLLICGGLGVLSLGMCVSGKLQVGVILSAIVVGVAVAGLFFPVSF